MSISVTGTVGILKTSVLAGHMDHAAADEILAAMVRARFYSLARTISDIV